MCIVSISLGIPTLRGRFYSCYFTQSETKGGAGGRKVFEGWYHEIPVDFVDSQHWQAHLALPVENSTELLKPCYQWLVALTTRRLILEVSSNRTE